MDNPMDRRRNPRAKVKVRMDVRDAETGSHHVLFTTNLSCGGARCTSALLAPRSGAILEGQLYLPLSEAGRDVDVAVPVRARVLRSEPCAGGYGVEYALAFDAMNDVDRAELAAYLFAWLADDTCMPREAGVGALS